MGKAKPWYGDPTKMIPLAVASVGLFGGFINFFIADAHQTDQLHAVEEDVQSLEASDSQQSDKIQDSYTQQQLIQKDVEYIKQQSNQILDAVKARR